MPFCVTFLSTPYLGVNPRGLIPNAVWQMDVTHINKFGNGNLKYVHVTIDIFTGINKLKYVHVNIDTFIFATLQSVETGKHVIVYLLSEFAVMRFPQQIKTNSGPGYIGKTFQQFCIKFNIKHTTKKSTRIGHGRTGSFIY